MNTGFPLPAMGLTELTGWLAQYLFAMLRIGAFLLASPAFGGRFLPATVRIMAGAVLALPVVATVPLPPPEALAGLPAIPLVMAELAIGLTAGLVLTILFGAAATAGDRIAATAGLGFAAQIDPAAGGQTPVVAQLFGIFTLMVFLAGDGHLVAIRILLESYATFPPGSPPALADLTAAGLTAGTGLFALAMGIMLPVVAVLLLVNFVIGVITRSAPALNLFSFGFPLTMTATLLLLWLTVPSMAGALEHLVETALALIGGLLATG
ncbi:MAG: flagellar biosynthetic protein FliR [Pseudomonadota bacterium]|jgi:flagellar biosynthetic protein FliR